MLADLFDDQTSAEFETLPEHNRIAFIAHAQWIAKAHAYQIPPDLQLDYRVFLMLAGRGAGKTRSAAEAFLNSTIYIITCKSHDTERTVCWEVLLPAVDWLEAV